MVEFQRTRDVLDILILAVITVKVSSYDLPKHLLAKLNPNCNGPLCSEFPWMEPCRGEVVAPFKTSFYPPPMPAIPLVQSGDAVIPPPAGVNPFYKKYTNAYVGNNFEEGIAIISTDRMPDAALLKVRADVNYLLRKRLDIRKFMARQSKTRVVLVAHGKTFCDHPESRYSKDGKCVIQGGGATLLETPSAVVEESGICYKDSSGKTQARFKGRNLVIEEFFHSMHETAMAFVAPEDICRISNLTSWLINRGLYHPQHLMSKVCPPFQRPTVESYCMPISDVPIECVATCVDAWFGQHHRGENDLKSRDDMRTRAYKMYELIAKYFDPNDNWKPC